MHATRVAPEPPAQFSGAQNRASGPAEASQHTHDHLSPLTTPFCRPAPASPPPPPSPADVGLGDLVLRRAGVVGVLQRAAHPDALLLLGHINQSHAQRRGRAGVGLGGRVRLHPAAAAAVEPAVDDLLLREGGGAAALRGADLPDALLLLVAAHADTGDVARRNVYSDADDCTPMCRTRRRRRAVPAAAVARRPAAEPGRAAPRRRRRRRRRARRRRRRRRRRCRRRRRRRRRPSRRRRRRPRRRF